jgi:hypothetical protein
MNTQKMKTALEMIAIGLAPALALALAVVLPSMIK